MRVRFIHKRLSVTCLFFDSEPQDLKRIVQSFLRLVDHVKPRNPIAFFVMLLQDVGTTSEMKRAELDKVIFDTEQETGTTAWCAKPEIVHWLDNSYKIMGSLHICRNNLVFVSRAVEMKLNTWAQLQNLNRGMFDTFQSAKDYAQKRGDATQQDIEFEHAYTRSRKAQIDDLKARVDVQITLVGFSSRLPSTQL